MFGMMCLTVPNYEMSSEVRPTIKHNPPFPQTQSSYLINSIHLSSQVHTYNPPDTHTHTHTHTNTRAPTHTPHVLTNTYKPKHTHTNQHTNTHIHTTSPHSHSHPHTQGIIAITLSGSTGHLIHQLVSAAKQEC